MSMRWCGRPTSRISRVAISGGSSISTTSASTPEPATGMVRSRPTLRRLLVGGLAGVGLAVPAFPGPREGLSAHDQGGYATAYRGLTPAAAPTDPLAQYTTAPISFFVVGAPP